MAIKQISIDEASPEQLSAFVKKFLNLELQPGQDARSAIMRAQPGNSQIFYEEAEAPIEGAAAPQPEGGMLGSLGRDDPKWTINIPMVETDDNSGKGDVVIGVNGRAWQIKRGVPVTIPHRVALALQNAITNQIRHNDDGEVIETPTPRFPFQTMAMPSAAEIEAWEERTQNEFCA